MYSWWLPPKGRDLFSQCMSCIPCCFAIAKFEHVLDSEQSFNNVKAFGMYTVRLRVFVRITRDSRLCGEKSFDISYVFGLKSSEDCTACSIYTKSNVLYWASSSFRNTVRYLIADKFKVVSAYARVSAVRTKNSTACSLTMNAEQYDCLRYNSKK